MPRTLLPFSSSGGDHTQKPSFSGTTTMMPPPTPDFAGTPIRKANSPEKSYMPQECISDRQCFTVEVENPRSLVSGFTPPLASVAATTAMESQVISMEQHWK